VKDKTIRNCQKIKYSLNITLNLIHKHEDKTAVIIHSLFWPTEDGSDLLGLGQVNVGNYIIHTLAFMNMEFVRKIYKSVNVI